MDSVIETKAATILEFIHGLKGTLWITFEEGTSANWLYDLLDPYTGRPAEVNGSVSVWHEQALVADILSTALYVMGPEKGLFWAESRNIAACFLVPDKDGRVKVLSSRSFRNLFF